MSIGKRKMHSELIQDMFYIVFLKELFMNNL